jgi:hypothetical protein
VLKSRHSAFFGRSLELLLEDLRVTTLILTGIADRTFALICCQRFEKEIDRPMRRARLRARSKGQDSPDDAEVRVAGNHIDVIRLDPLVVRGFLNRQRRGSREQVRERAVVLRIEMLHEHEGDARIEWQVLQRRERFESSSRSADANDRERFVGTWPIARGGNIVRWRR